MKFILILTLALLALREPATAATLYRWRDASGVDRYGYQPPPGAEAVPAEEERRAIYDRGPLVRCEDLAKQHLVLIDREIARVRDIRAGLGPEFQMTPATQQQLVLDLLAQRAALVTGRPAVEFKSPSNDEILRSRNELQARNQQLKDNLQNQDLTITAQQRQLERDRRTMRFLRPFGWGGIYGYPPYYFPYSPIVP